MQIFARESCDTAFLNSASNFAVPDWKLFVFEAKKINGTKRYVMVEDLTSPTYSLLKAMKDTRMSPRPTPSRGGSAIPKLISRTLS